MSDLKKVLTATDRASKSIIKATSDLSIVITNLGICVKTNEALTTDIEFKQSELSQLEADAEVKLRTLNAELWLKVLENEDKVLADLLRKRKMEGVTFVKLSELEVSLETALESNEVAIESAVVANANLLHARYGGEKKSLQSEHLVAVAQKDADNRALIQKVDFMQQTIDGLQETIKAERDARIAMAESASKASGVVVNTASK